MRTIRAICSGLTFLTAFACATSVAAAEPAPGEAGWLYDPGKVVAIDLTLSPQAISELEAEPDEYVKGTFALSTTNGTPGGEEVPVGSPLTDVGIRLKGGANGSFRKLTGKAAFKLKFNKFVKGQKFEGLKKMTLNNMLEDSSMIHETLTYDAFRAAGVTASRTGYADVRVNGEDFGVYLNIETLDDVALERWFGPKSIQHLYEGEDGSDVTPGVDELPAGEGGFEVDEGDEKNLEDLKALVAAANSTEGEGWSAAVAPVANLSEMTRTWAIEKYSGHWDAYAGQEGEFLPNNFYLFSEPSGVFQMIPWGTDETWERRLKFDGPAGLLFNRCLADPACDALYRKELKSAGKTIADLGLDSLAVKAADLLEPWEQQEQANSRHEHDPSEIQQAVDKARSFIADRPGELAAFLGPEESPRLPQAVETAPESAAPSLAVPSLFVGHSRREHAALVTYLRLPGPGLVSQTATFETVHGRRNACSIHASVLGGDMDLLCSLSALALSRLRLRGLALRVRTSFVAAGGAEESASRRIHLARSRQR
jgi:hypothetical protein